MTPASAVGTPAAPPVKVVPESTPVKSPPVTEPAQFAVGPVAMLVSVTTLLPIREGAMTGEPRTFSAIASFCAMVGSVSRPADGAIARKRRR